MKTRHAATAFDGEGARRFGGRWNSPGTRVAYASDSVALAVLEVLVHLEASDLLPSYSLASADVPHDLIEILADQTLPARWKDSPPPAPAAAVGDRWIANGSAAVLSVPSVIVETARNYLINPAHPDFERITIRKPKRFAFDKRLRQ